MFFTKEDFRNIQIVRYFLILALLILVTSNFADAQRFKESYTPDELTGADRATFIRGMTSWGTERTNIGACMDCHAPDGLDLAFVNVTDDDIKRRARGDGLTGNDVQNVVDLINFQRKRFGITPVNRFTFRPMQPGPDKQPLCGDSPQARDEKYGDEIAKVIPGILERYPKSIEEAKERLNHFLAVDLKKLPIPMPLPLLVSDSANDPKLGTVDEWVPIVPCKPRNQKFNDIRGAYIKNPTRDTFWEYFRAMDEKASNATCNLPMARFPNPVGKSFEAKKFRALQLFQHRLREEITGFDGPDFFEGPAAFLDYGFKYLDSFKKLKSSDKITAKHLEALPGDVIWDMSDMNRKANGQINWTSTDYTHQDYLRMNGWPGKAINDADQSYMAGSANHKLMLSWLYLSTLVNDVRMVGYLLEPVREQKYYIAHSFRAMHSDYLNYFAYANSKKFVGPRAFQVGHRIHFMKYMTPKQVEIVRMMTLSECTMGIYLSLDTHKNFGNKSQKIINDDNIQNVNHCLRFVRLHSPQDNDFYTGLLKKWVARYKQVYRAVSNNFGDFERRLNNKNDPAPEKYNFLPVEKDFIHGVHDSPRCQGAQGPSPVPPKVDDPPKNEDNPRNDNPMNDDEPKDDNPMNDNPRDDDPNNDDPKDPDPAPTPNVSTKGGMVVDLGGRRPGRTFCLMMDGEAKGKVVRKRRDSYRPLSERSLQRKVNSTRVDRKTGERKYKAYADCVNGELDMANGTRVESSSIAQPRRRKSRSRKARRARKRRAKK